MYKNETKLLKRLNEVMRNREMDIYDISNALSVSCEELQGEIDLLVEKGNLTIRYRSSVPVKRNGSTQFIKSDPAYRFSSYGKDVVSTKRDDWIKFWIPVTVSIIALILSIVALTRTLV